MFGHDIYRKSDEALCFRCQADLVVLINGRLGHSDAYDRALSPYTDTPCTR